VQHHVGEGERQTPRFGRVQLGESRGLQGRVQQRGVDAERPRLTLPGLGQVHLGEDPLPVTPGPAKTLE
jgi:hypothetical protein